MQDMAAGFLMLGNISTASEVKERAPVGAVILLISSLNAYKSLKNVGIDCAIGCSIISTHLPIGLVMLATSEHTGRDGVLSCIFLFL